MDNERRIGSVSTPSSPDFASRLQDALATRGISQKKLAATVGVSQNTVTSWSKGRYRPDHRNLTRIATALGMTLDELHEGSLPPDSLASAARGFDDDMPTDDEARRIVERLAAFELDASLREIRRVTPDLLHVLAAARAYAQRNGDTTG